MTAEQFEKYGKTFIYENIMKKEEYTMEQKMEYATKKLKEIVDKYNHEKNDKKFEAYEDKV